ncbi:MAG TPA: O-antigen ligase family protein [Geopsychrobacteraceae bacterium]|nr:O-antigen ligase family protein [Geopsychrobacteraceae bacterium]
MPLDRAQRRALEREQRKESGRQKRFVPVAFNGAVPVWMTVLIALPVLLVPLFVVYMLPGTLIPGSYGQASINEFQKYAAELVSVAALLSGFVFLLLRHNLYPRLPRYLVLAVAIYLLGVMLSLTQAVDIERALIISLQVSLCPVLFFLLIITFRWTQSHVLLVLGLTFTAGFLVALIGICQTLGVWDFALRLPHVGAGSLIYFQNLAGEYLILLIPPAIILIFMPIHWSFRIFSTLLSLVFLVHLVMTLARGAWVGLFGGVLFSLLCAGWCFYLARKRQASSDEMKPLLSPKQKRSLLIVAVLLLTVLLGGGVWIAAGGKGSDSTYVQELLSINLKNTTGRLQIWTDSMSLLKESWLLGIGSGHYRIDILPHLKVSPQVPYLFDWVEQSGKIMYPFRPHNDYLQNWIELGLFGLIGMLWLFFIVVRSAFRGIGEAFVAGDRGRALLILGCLGGFSSWAVSMLFEFPYRMPASMMLGWLCAGLTVALSRQGDDVVWKKVGSGVRWSSSLLLMIVVISCLYVAHIQFWSDIYEKQAMAAWNSRNTTQGYQWIERAYAYAPWKQSIGGMKARMELGLGKNKEALQTSQETLERNPYLLPVLWTKGTSARMLGRSRESREAFATIIKLYPHLKENGKYTGFSTR